MKKNLLTSALVGITFLFCSLNAFAQPSKGGNPRSFLISKTATIQSLVAEEVTVPTERELTDMDEADMKNGVLRRIGRSVMVNYTPQNSGTWDVLPDGGKIWRLKMHLSNAKAVGVYYDQFYLPPGTELFLYNENKKQILGAYTSENNPVWNTFATELIEGETVTLEFYQPASVTASPLISINELAYIYRDYEARYDEMQTRDFGDSDASCEVNANCSEGTAWQNQKRAVTRILVKEGSAYGWCSGTLMNNTALNCSPYILTADHCSGNGVASTADLTQWIFYFNYEAPTCSNPATEGTLASKSITGCTLKARGGQSGAIGSTSDFYLVLLGTSVPSTWNPYYAGWSRVNATSSSGVSIHHPAGDIKKISTYSSNLIADRWSGGTINGTHWRVTWVATANGHGVTEGGSSGSGIFNSSGLLIGQLSGGSSYCTALTSPDLYGAFWYDWDQNTQPATNNKLKPWLDPGNTGATTLSGTNAPCGPSAPVADFSANNTTPCIGSTVLFTDLSTGTPTSWTWTFSPTSVTYVGGTSASSQNPQVQFNAAGPYTVTLLASNSIGNNTVTKTSYITPTTAGTLPLVENFEAATFPPTGWSIVNADAPSVAWGTAGAKGFVRRAAAGNTGSTSGSAGIECFNYNTDTTQVDELITKPVSLVGATAPRMTFKRAYKYYGAPYLDELRVFVSTDCGATYGSAVYYKKGVQLATNGTLTTTFTPSVAADWDIDTVSLTSYIGQNILVKFQVTSKYGNNVYLDDVNINSTAGAVASVSIAQTTGTNPTCAGSSVTFTATPTNGGTAPTYQWQVNGVNSGTGATFTTNTLTNGQIVTCIMTSNLAGVTGSPATSNSITMTVTTPPVATFSYTGTPYCKNATNPSPTFSGGGSAGTFTSTAGLVFVSATTGVVNLTTSTPGTYTVTNTKPAAGGCPAVTATSTITITAPSVATFSYTGSPYCQNATNPSPTFSGGGSAGTFTSTAGLSINATTGVVNLAASTPGTYTVTNTKAAAGGCPQVTATSTITITAPSVATFSYTGTPYCQNATNPSPTFSGGGSAGTFTSTAGLSINATTGVVNLAASTPGTYTVTNTKAAAGGCPQVTATSTITITAPSVATFSYTGTPYCQNATNPSPTFSGGGSAGTFTSTAGLSLNATTGVVNLAASTPGTYTVTNTKAAAGGCPQVTATSTITITAPSVATFSYTGTPYCQNATNPSPTFSGGGSAGTFTSTAGLSLNATTGVVNLAASTPGTYTVTNTKAAAGGCPQVIATSTITISAPAVATFSYTGTPYCKSSTNPSPTFSGGGSAGTFTSTAGLVINSTTGVVNLAASTAGTYTVTNTKPAAGGCPVITATSSITILSGPTAQAVSTTNTGCGASTGTITIGVTTGGTGPYSYSVNGSGFTSTTTYTGLASGSYPVIVKDANGCQFSTTATVSNSSGPTAQAVITSSSTCGNANGGITIGTTTGGTGPYTYSVNGSGFTATTSYTGLAAGAYPVIVKDAGGCQFTTSATITNIAGPSSTATSTAATCGNSNGSAGVNVTGGTPGYTYLWTPTGGASATLTNVIAGTYTVIVTDNNGCNSTAVTTVANIAGPTAQATSTSNATCGGTNGTISIGATSGGTSPFMYSVDGSAASTTTVYNGFAAGSYPVIVTDANGCMFSTSVTVGNTGTIPSTPTITQSGSTLTSSSATGNQWYNNGVAMPGETGQTFTFTANGNYTVIVTNGGCSSASSAVMSVTNVGIAESGKDPYSFLIYPNPNDGHFTLSFFANDRSTYRVEIVNALGQAVFKADLIDFSGNYKKEMSVVEYGQGIYTISLTNSTNETVRKIIVY